MPQRLELTLPASLLLLSACMPIETIREVPAAVVTQAPKERVVIREVIKPQEGCGSLLSEYAEFTRYSDDIKRQEIRIVKNRIKSHEDACDSLRLALFHSAPGKLRQTDETINELLDSVKDKQSVLGSDNHALVTLLKNEMSQRSVVEKKVGRHNSLLDQERAENRQLLQRLAELQLQLDQLKSLESNIDPE